MAFELLTCCCESQGWVHAGTLGQQHGEGQHPDRVRGGCPQISTQPPGGPGRAAAGDPKVIAAAKGQSHVSCDRV